MHRITNKKILINFFLYYFSLPSSTSNMEANMSRRYLIEYHAYSISLKKKGRNEVSHDKKNIDQILDVPTPFGRRHAFTSTMESNMSGNCLKLSHVHVNRHQKFYQKVRCSPKKPLLPSQKATPESKLYQ